MCVRNRAQNRSPDFCKAISKATDPLLYGFGFGDHVMAHAVQLPSPLPTAHWHCAAWCCLQAPRHLQGDTAHRRGRFSADGAVPCVRAILVWWRHTTILTIYIRGPRTPGVRRHTYGYRLYMRRPRSNHAPQIASGLPPGWTCATSALGCLEISRHASSERLWS